MKVFFNKRNFVFICLKQNLIILTIFLSFAQVVVSQNIDPANYFVTNETIRMKADGKLSIILPTSYSGDVSMEFEFKGLGNFQIKNKLAAKRGRLLVGNLHPGKYFNIKFYDKDEQLLGFIDNFDLGYGKNIKVESNLRSVCPNLTFPDCEGNIINNVSLESGKAYPLTSTTAPCGIEVSDDCTVTNLNYWHCIDGNLSSPSPYTKYVTTDFSGAGLTALEAARIGWIICNYPLPTTDTDPTTLAIWYLTGTGGNANSVYNAAINAVTSANGTENNLVFYKSSVGSAQDYIKWSCPIVCNSTPLSVCGTNISQIYNVISNGQSCTPSPWTEDEHVFSVVGGPNAGAYQIKPGTSPRIIEYTDGSLKGFIEVSYSLGVTGSVDNSRGYLLEISGTQRSVGTPTSGLSPETACGVTQTDSWIFYNSYLMQACGTGSNAGHMFVVSGPIDGNNHPLQIGNGANATNLSLGCGIWYSNMGGGDLTLRLEPQSHLVVDAGTDAALCFGQSKPLSALASNGVAPYHYEWSDGLPNGAIRTVGGTYTVTVTDYSGCTNLDQIQITQNPQLFFEMQDIEVCPGPNFLVTANASGGTPGFSYNWSGGLGSGYSKSIPTTNATYTVTVTDTQGCSATDAFSVSLTANSSSGLSGPTEVCMDEYGVFSASPVVSGATYAWTFDGGTSLDGDANDPSESVKWASTYANTIRTVTLVVTKDFCSSTYTKDVFVKQGAFLNTQANYSVCQGGTVQIGPNPQDPDQVSPGASFTWTPSLFLNNNTVGQPLCTPPFDMQYTLTATVDGCATSMQISVDVDVNLNPIADAGNDKSICLSESTTIGGNPTATPPPFGGTINGVVWTLTQSGTEISTQNNPLISPTQNSQYRVVVVASNGCTDTDFVNITVNSKQRIGNFTWVDENGDGCQNAGEIGLNDINVSLFSSTGTLISTMTTTNHPTSGMPGYYLFEVCPGNYYVNFGKPEGYIFTQKNGCSDISLDSDADIVSGNSAPIALLKGQDNFTIDAGFIIAGNVRGSVKADTNNDNIGDSPLSNVTINLKDLNGNIVATDVTDVSGNYEFLNVPVGQYILMEVQPNGYSSISDVDDTPDPDGNDGATPNDMIPVTVTAGENDNDNNFVEANLASIGNFVWEDRDADGIQEAGEPGIPNVVVRLFNNAGIQIASKITDNSGHYLFLNLLPGSYTIKFDKPTGYEPTPKHAGTESSIDSDADLVTGLTTPVILSGGEENLTIDAGYYKLARIGNFVWEDENANGIQDNFESGIAGVIVTLLGTDAQGNIIDTMTTTDENGYYSFTGLQAGVYSVKFTKPNNYKPSPANATSDDGKDSDADVITGQSPLINVESGTDNQTIDAGFYKCGFVGNFVWLDNNLNNLQDANDAGINGIVVELYEASNPSAPVQSMVTTNYPNNPNLAGYYNFEVCEPGNYFIKVKADMNSYSWVLPNQGSYNGIDSDITDFENQTTDVFTLGYAENLDNIDAGLSLRPLPVSLSSFTGRWNELIDVNELNWVTMSEINNNYFQLERSFQGSPFEKIAKVSGQGNSTKIVSYSIEDQDIERNGMYYYRLRTVDFDGRENYSSIVEIQVNKPSLNNISIYPNPSVGQVQISVKTNIGEKVEAKLYDNTGRLVLNSIIDEVSFGNELNSVIESEFLKKGVYVIKVNIDGRVSSHKLIILH